MRTSHLDIRKKVLDEKGKISDEELFSSPAIAAYLSDIGEGVSKRYNRPFRVKTYWDPSPGAEAAWTDNRTVTINTGNPISMSFPKRETRLTSLIGMLGHENGHILFSDFRALGIYQQRLAQGRFYPKKPADLPQKEHDAVDELQSFAANEDVPALKVVLKVASTVNNLLEDAYIEEMMCREFPGKIRTGISINRVRMMEQSRSINAMIDSGLEELPIMLNLLIQYCFQGTVNNIDGYKGPFLDLLSECIPYVDDSKFADDARIRFDASNHILLKLWDYLKPLIEKARKEPPEDVVQQLDDKLMKGSIAPTGKTRPVPGYHKAGGESDPDERFEVQQVDEADGNRIALEKTDDPEHGSGGTLAYDDAYGGAGYENCGRDIDRLLSSIAEDRVNTREEQELTAELQAEANHIAYGNAHHGVHVTINRMSVVPEDLVSEYARVSAPLLLLSRRMQKQVAQVLKDRRQGGKQNGLLMGRRLESRSLVRNDGRYFYKNNLPQERAELAVALLVDESGSMSYLDRITTARAASIVIYDFCRKLGVPVMVMGHTSGGQHVELYSYADFNSVDGKDCYRMMDMSARGCNRDGAALRYVAEQLVKRSEQNRLLILISDGQPAADGYHGTGAEADLRGIRKEYTNKGITMFAAAIGDDKANIERIYKEGYLDITDLNKLPQNLAKLIARYVRAA